MKHIRPSLQQLIGKKGLVGCEIGVQTGKNAEYMLNTLNIKRLYLIDPYEAYIDCGKGRKDGTITSYKASAMGRMRIFGKKVIWIFKKSSEAYIDIPDLVLDFLYVDGLHNYEGVCLDLELYEPKVKVGGLIAGHDYNLRGVKKAVNERYGDRVMIGVCSGVEKKRRKRYTYDWWVWKNGT